MTGDVVAAEIAAIIATLNSLSFVRWDRFTATPDALSVFGWIDREDSHADFVLVEWRDEGMSFLTSSAARTNEIAALLGIEEHHDWRVEMIKGVRNVIRGGSEASDDR